MFKKNTAVTGFGIGHFIGVADGIAVTTGTPTCKRTLDGTGGACANTASYNTDGAVWEIDLAAGDMNGDVVVLSFALAGCIPISYAIKTTTVLVSELNDFDPANDTVGLVTTVTNLTNLPAAAALEATLTAMKGAGWTTQTLVSIASQITSLPATLSYGIIEAMIRDDTGYVIGDIVSGSVVDIVRDTIRGADNDTLKTLSDQIDGIGAGSSLTAQQTRDAMMLAPSAGAPAAGSIDDHLDDMPADVWAYIPRTLTEGSTTTTDATAAGSITRKRGNSWSISLTLGAITGYTSLWFTVKHSYDDPDSAAILQIKLNSPSAADGLLTVNSATATSSALGSITVSNATTGAIVVAVDETVTDDLPVGVFYYDAQVLISGSVTTPEAGTFTLTADVTRAVV